MLNQKQSGSSIRAIRSRVSRLQLKKMHSYAKLYTPAADRLADKLGNLTHELDLTEVAWSATRKSMRAIATRKLAARVEDLFSFRALILVSEKAKDESTRQRAIERLEALGKHGCIIEPILD